MLGRKRKKAVKSTHKIIDKSNKNNHVDYQEVYRNIRTNIEYSAVGKNVKAINITSSISNEGKSTTALNLAMIYATKYPYFCMIWAIFWRPKPCNRGSALSVGT